VAGYIDEDVAARDCGHYRLICNRRGRVVRAQVRGRDMPLVPLSSRGFGFEQVLPGGYRVFALRGVRGSEPETADGGGLNSSGLKAAATVTPSDFFAAGNIQK
jgi:hypothetical protein